LSNHAGVAESSDFSLVLGGPLSQLFRRTHLSGNVLELLVRRMIVRSLRAKFEAAIGAGASALKMGESAGVGLRSCPHWIIGQAASKQSMGSYRRHRSASPSRGACP